MPNGSFIEGRRHWQRVNTNWSRGTSAPGEREEEKKRAEEEEERRREERGGERIKRRKKGDVLCDGERLGLLKERNTRKLIAPRGINRG